ncbi:hypothetical protein K469DRAFT_558314, partial [Zopfia rhizophila CBS 207.26]
HNYNIYFIMIKYKSLAFIFYIINYITKVEDLVWKRVTIAKKLFYILENKITRN